MKRPVKRGMGVTGDNSLSSMTFVSPGGWVRALALGIVVSTLFSVGLYLSISGLVVVFLALVL
jgi:hypothetical protein